MHSEETGMHLEVTVAHLEETVLHCEETQVHLEDHSLDHIESHVGAHNETHFGVHVENHYGEHIELKKGKVEQVEDISKIYVTKTELATQVTQITESMHHVESALYSILAKTGITIVTSEMSIDAFGGLDIFAPTVTIEGTLVNIV